MQQNIREELSRQNFYPKVRLYCMDGSPGEVKYRASYGANHFGLDTTPASMADMLISGEREMGCCIRGMCQINRGKSNYECSSEPSCSFQQQQQGQMASVHISCNNQSFVTFSGVGFL